MKVRDLIYKLAKFGLDKDVHFSDSGYSILHMPLSENDIQERELVKIKDFSPHYTTENFTNTRKVIDRKKAVVIRSR